MKEQQETNRMAFNIAFPAALVSVMLLSLLSPSCKDQTLGPRTEIVFPDSNISFINYVEPLFRQKCVSCHNSSLPNGNLNLDVDNMWQALIDYQGFVIPGHGDTSPLVLCLEGESDFPPMPPGHPLTTNQINGIKKWIDEGALYN
jgi:hypothetical protein